MTEPRVRTRIQPHNRERIQDAWMGLGQLARMHPHHLICVTTGTLATVGISTPDED